MVQLWLFSLLYRSRTHIVRFRMMLKMAMVPPCATSALQTTHSEVVKYSIKSGTIENTTMTKIMLSPSSLLLGINKYKLMDRQTNIKIV